MKLIVIICHNRTSNLDTWAKLLLQMDLTNCKVCFATTGNNNYFCSTVETIRYPNLGMDIGVLQRIIQQRDDYDTLMWLPDDFFPIRRDVFQLYDTADVVGTFWSTETSQHIRSGAVCVTKEVAKTLQFPPELLIESDVEKSKYNCHRFEHLDYNFYNQVKDKFSVRMVDGTKPPKSPYWRTKPQRYFRDTIGQPNVKIRLQ